MTARLIIGRKFKSRAFHGGSLAGNQYGRFTLRSIVPGDYKVFAWDGAENFAYFDPDFLRRYEGGGKTMHIDESARINLDLKVIPLTN